MNPLSQLVIDGHVHIYPRYDWPAALAALVSNLSAAGTTESLPIGLLAESRSCRFYQEATGNPSAFRQGSLRLEVGPDAGSLAIRKGEQLAGYLIAGRQIVTAEKLEVLALGVDVTIAAGQPVGETLDGIREQGAVPVLSWSPGKWFFARGKLVRNLIESRPAGSFLIGDTGLRPSFWPMPVLMRLASQRGFKIIGGSDPLPLPREEFELGSYGFSVTTRFDTGEPATSLRRILSSPASEFILTGKRATPLNFLSRWVRNQIQKH